MEKLKLLVYDEHYDDVCVWRSWYDAKCHSPEGYSFIIDNIVQIVACAHPKIPIPDDIKDIDVEVGFIDSETSLKEISKMYSVADVIFFRKNIKYSDLSSAMMCAFDMISILEYNDHIEVNLPTKYL